MVMRFSTSGKIWICLALLFYQNAFAQNQDSDCLFSALDQQQNQELMQLECPEFFHRLLEKDLIDTMASDLPEQFSRSQLQYLIASMQTTDNRTVLDRTGLDNLLAEIYVEHQQDETNSLWQQFLGWLKHFKPENHEAEFTWLVHFLDSITPSEYTARIMMYGAFALIIILTIVLVFKELSIAGMFSRKKTEKKTNGQVFDNKIANIEKPLSIEEIRQLEPRKQLPGLFKTVIDHLVKQGDLPENKILTNQELKQKLCQHESSSDKIFTLLLDEVEPVLYGGVQPSEQILKRSWQYAEKILHSPSV